MRKIEKTKLLHDRLDRYDKKKYLAKRKKLGKNLNIGEKVLVLAKELRKNVLLENLINNLYRILPILIRKRIRKKHKIDKIGYYWLVDLQTSRHVKKRFQRTELFAIKNNFSM